MDASASQAVSGLERREPGPTLTIGFSVCRDCHKLIRSQYLPRQTDADHGKVRVDYRMPVGLSGFRDHRPLVARDYAQRARWKQQQLEEEKPNPWDRTLVEREYRQLLRWESAAKKGKMLPVRRSQCFFNSGERSIEWCATT